MEIEGGLSVAEYVLALHTGVHGRAQNSKKVRPPPAKKNTFFFFQNQRSFLANLRNLKDNLKNY